MEPNFGNTSKAGSVFTGDQNIDLHGRVSSQVQRRIWCSVTYSFQITMDNPRLRNMQIVKAAGDIEDLYHDINYLRQELRV